MQNPTVIRFNPNDPSLREIREIARFTRMGKIVAFPTETVYGIGVPASKKEALERLYQIKGRDREKPLAYHVGDWKQLGVLGVVRSPAFRYLSKKFWPGPVTLIVHRENGEKIGVRFPKSVPACVLITSAGEPFLATSANRSGEPSPRTVEEVLQALGGAIDYVIDAGPCEVGKDSTVVDVTTDPPQILREGAEIEAVRRAIEDIQYRRIPRKRILVVCTGNSCRSPMAAGLIQEELRRKRLEREIEVTTCGILARDGGSATAEAIYVMKNREIDISTHRSHCCRQEDIMDADLIIAMAAEHSDFIMNLAPAARNKVMMFDIPDPIGMGMPVYEDVVKKLEEKIRKEWQDIVK